MKELFYADGHLTDDAFLALVHNDENLTELERLEISEHLSFCDECIIRYTACLEDDSLLIAPMLSSQETIIKRIKEIGRAHV